MPRSPHHWQVRLPNIMCDHDGIRKLSRFWECFLLEMVKWHPHQVRYVLLYLQKATAIWFLGVNALSYISALK